MKCRHCKKKLDFNLIDLGVCPPSNNYVEKKKINQKQKKYPLRVNICKHCWLTQTEDFASSSDLFSNDYAYLSSTSKTWVDHCKKFSRNISKKLKLGKDSLVVEIASNDGCLIENFHKMKIPSIGIEPTKSTAKISRKKGIETVEKFFGLRMAKKFIERHGKADLVCANNVFAHVPDINDFVAGLKKILKSDGTITIEFPHLLKLIKDNLFDTIYHEHFSYLSLTTASIILNKVGLRIYYLEKLKTHGESLRIYVCNNSSSIKTRSEVNKFLQYEENFGLFKIKTYKNFKKNVYQIQKNLLFFLKKMKASRKKVIAYGAAAKGNTLLNSINIKSDLIEYVCDDAISKQGKYLPGSLIPIIKKDIIFDDKPEIILILPWNISKEVISKLKNARKWKCKFFVALPKLKEVK